MRLVLDFEAFTTAVDFGDGDVVPLRRPTLSQWCMWQSEHERCAATESFDPDSIPDKAPAADLNLAILTHHMIRPTVLELDSTHPVWLALHDRQMTAELLTFWRDYPLSPWVNAAPDGGEASDPDKRLITSSLPGAFGARAVLYRALAERLSPVQIDNLELWQIAVLLGVDDGASAAPGERAVDELDDGGRITRRGNVETRSWRRKPGAPFLFSAPHAR